MSRAAFDVLDGGLLTTVQDAGRPDWTDQGVPVSGAADPWSHAVANLLSGNDPAAAALEMTIAGPTLVARVACSIGLAGADLRARVRGGRALATGQSHRLAAGDVVEIPGDPAAAPGSGGRGYLAVPGGVDVPVVLGSRSTCLAGGFGGVDGRALRAGDEIVGLDDVRNRTSSADILRSGGAPVSDSGIGQRGGIAPELIWPESTVSAAAPGAPAVLRVLAGPLPGLDALATRSWRVAISADRVGLRLDGDPLPDGIAGETTTHAVPWGAIQVPPDGRPIVLGADHQVTGGYRVVGVVITADRPVLGQLRPGAAVRFVATDRPAALIALAAQRDALAAGAAALRDAAGWDALIGSAGG